MDGWIVTDVESHGLVVDQLGRGLFTAGSPSPVIVTTHTISVVPDFTISHPAGARPCRI